MASTEIAIKKVSPVAQPTASSSSSPSSRREASWPTLDVSEYGEPDELQDDPLDDQFSSSQLLQTVSIKLPANMAVLVVPVNLTSVTDDDAMQLQQIGKRVAIIRGAMTNVAEFQVLPAMTFDPMETDIRQIVTNETDESIGPTIQITPQVIDTEPEIIEEVITEIPDSPCHSKQPVEVEKRVERVAKEPSPPPPQPKPKLFSYIEAIRCGRCLKEFNDLLEVSVHQKKVHKMMTIEVSAERVQGAAEDKTRYDPAQVLSTMEDKIAARSGRGGSGAGKGVKRAATAGTTSRGRSSKVAQPVSAVRGGRGGGGARGRGGGRKGNNLLTCSICSMNFVEENLYNSHVQAHQQQTVAAGEDGLSELIEQIEEQDTKQIKYTIVSNPFKSDLSQSTTEHIITDSLGNQVVVHAETQEELQELLTSLESGGGLQMLNGSREATVTDDNGGVYVITEDVEMADDQEVEEREQKVAVAARGSRR